MNVRCCDSPNHVQGEIPLFGPPMFGERLADMIAPYEHAGPTGHPFLPPFLEQALSPRTEADAGNGKPEFEVADIFRIYGEAYRAAHNQTSEQLDVMYAIENCRTATYGFNTDVCDSYGHTESAYNSCRNRHCPKCQGIARCKWVNKRLDELLPVSYHHATITLPNELSVLSLHNRQLIYDLLFDAASRTLLAFGYDEKWLGGRIGFYGILHTQSQTLWPHGHLHLIVTAGDLILTDDMRTDHATAFEMWIDRLVSRNWVVHSKAPFAGPEEVVRYIGRYTHRVAIGNHRILSISDGLIRFTYKDNKEKDKTKLWKEMTLPADQFITRFLWHVLPKGYHRIRHYGFLNNGQKHANLAKIREIQTSRIEGEVPAETEPVTDVTGMPCLKCKNGRMRPFLVIDGYGQILKCDISVFPIRTKGKYDDTS